jgi:ribose-phosphate pyrophosphokinase
MPLATEVARSLGTGRVLPLQTQVFSNGQIEVKGDFAGPEIAIFQAFPDRVHDRLFELLFILDLLRARGCQHLTAVLPHLPYARSDRPAIVGGPVPARLLAELMEHAGLSRLITVELHSPQVTGFFRCPVINIEFLPALIRHLDRRPARNWTIASPDLGGAKRAERLAAALKCPLAVIRKHREGDQRRSVEVLGEVARRDILLVDDEINTGKTLFSAADLLRARGASSVSLAVVHALLTPEATTQLQTSDFEYVFVSNTTAIDVQAKEVEVISIASEIVAALQVS